MPKNPFKWLYPGMKVKRWFFTSLLGVVIVGVGAVLSSNEYEFVSVLGVFWILFLTAMVQLTDGDFERAVKETSKVLAIRGKVVPATVSNIHLIAEYSDGTKMEGEARIPSKGVAIDRLSLTDEDAYPTSDALAAIEDADIIILGPGSLYTSIIPNLIIKGMSDAIAKASAFKIYVCNVMTQKGETTGD